METWYSRLQHKLWGKKTISARGFELRAQSPKLIYKSQVKISKASE